MTPHAEAEIEKDAVVTLPATDDEISCEICGAGDSFPLFGGPRYVVQTGAASSGPA